MTEMKHTPTPWKANAIIQNRIVGDETAPKFDKIQINGANNTVATVYRSGDAAFIKRAVNAHDAMLEALQLAIRSRWLSIDIESNRTREACDIRSAICAAIDKATGAQ